MDGVTPGDKLTETGKQSHPADGRIRLKSFLSLPTPGPSDRPGIPSPKPIAVVLIIPAALERLGWSIVIDGQTDMRIVSQFAACDEALDFLASNTAEVVVMDDSILTPKDCEQMLSCARSRGIRFLLLGRHPIAEESTRAAYGFAAGYLLKGLPAADLLAAIRAASSSHT